MNSTQRGAFRTALACALLVSAGCSSSSESEDTGADTVAPDVIESDAAPDTPVDTQPDAPPDAGPDVPDAEDDADAAADSDLPEECPVWWSDLPQATDGPGVGTDGPDPADPFEEGSARAGRVRDGDGDFAGLYAACRTGDWVIENDVLRACIADERSMTAMLFDGGNLMDLELRNAPGNDELYYLVTASGLLNQAADRVELIDDGSGGGDAVVRVSGPDTLMMFIAATIGNLAPSINTNLVTEYRLSPGSTALEVVTWIEKADAQRTVVRMGDLVAGGDTTEGWLPDHGFSIPPVSTTIPFFASVGESHSIGIAAEGLSIQPLTLPEIDIPFGNLTAGSGLLCPGDTAAFRRWITVGAGDTVSLRERLSDHLPPTERVEVTFESRGAAVQFEVRTEEGDAVDVIRVNGTLTTTLPAGDYEAWSMNSPAEEPPPTAFSVPGEPIVFEPPEVGEVEIFVVADGDPVSAQLTFSGPVTREAFATLGVGRVQLPPGTYDYWVWRGIEYSVETGTVDVEVGETARFDVELERELDTRGWVGGDLHQHGTPSPDSAVSLADRVRSNLAAGVEFIAPTDHDAVGDYRGAMRDLGLADELFLLQGEELSPGQGHINLFPRRYDRQTPFAGGIPLGSRGEDGRELEFPTSGEYVTMAREAGVRFVQLNHPRGTLAHFSSTGYDPVLGPDANDDENWFDDFDAVEVYNTPGTFCVGLQDWFSLLNHGRRVTGTGTSDTHDFDLIAGWPRTYVAVGHESPQRLNAETLLSGLRNLEASVSGGIFIELGGGLSPGQSVAARPDGSVTVRVRIAAPSWVAVDELNVFVNGVLERTIPIDSPRGELLDRTDRLDFEFEVDSHLVFVAHSDTLLEVVAPGERPFGFTNPLFVDVDGGGWSAPGVADATAAPLPSGLPNCD